ncbi:MAG: hypothetical protein JWM75_202 [Sphingomonas bacterium]|nr:hypothetical protein [Sphingomonas bacterium]
MAKQNGGKNPPTPLSNSDFQALASSLCNLETSQSEGRCRGNVQRVIDVYTRAYQGAREMTSCQRTRCELTRSPLITRLMLLRLRSKHRGRGYVTPNSY